MSVLLLVTPKLPPYLQNLLNASGVLLNPLDDFFNSSK